MSTVALSWSVIVLITTIIRPRLAPPQQDFRNADKFNLTLSFSSIEAARLLFNVCLLLQSREILPLLLSLVYLVSPSRLHLMSIRQQLLSIPVICIGIRVRGYSTLAASQPTPSAVCFYINCLPRNPLSPIQTLRRRV